MNRAADKSKINIKPRSVAATKLDMLISHYESIDDQLRQEIEADREVDAIKFLDQQLQKVLKSLRDFRAEDQQEAYKHLMFFLGDATQRENSVARAIGPDVMADLLRDYMLPTPLPRAGPQFSDIASVIDNSPNRISLIDLEHRYQFTSKRNASIYRCAPRDICGQHVAEVIGGDRFVGRAKGFFERCFQGEIVQYAHVLEEPGSDGVNYMKCQMQPHIDTTGTTVGAIVTMTDITQELLANVNDIDLEPIALIYSGLADD